MKNFTNFMKFTYVCDLICLFCCSDLTIHLEGSNNLHGHRFVLAARSDYWGVDDLAKVSELDFAGNSHSTIFLQL